MTLVTSAVSSVMSIPEVYFTFRRNANLHPILMQIHFLPVWCMVEPHLGQVGLRLGNLGLQLLDAPLESYVLQDHAACAKRPVLLCASHFRLRFTGVLAGFCPSVVAAMF